MPTVFFAAAAADIVLNLDVKMFVVRQTENRFKCVDEVEDIL